jgi:hypothetical protein
VRLAIIERELQDDYERRSRERKPGNGKKQGNGKKHTFGAYMYVFSPHSLNRCMSSCRCAGDHGRP